MTFYLKFLLGYIGDEKQLKEDQKLQMLHWKDF